MQHKRYVLRALLGLLLSAQLALSITGCQIDCSSVATPCPAECDSCVQNPPVEYNCTTPCEQDTSNPQCAEPALSDSSGCGSAGGCLAGQTLLQVLTKGDQGDGPGSVGGGTCNFSRRASVCGKSCSDNGACLSCNAGRYGISCENACTCGS
jgi:hypothetical protein